MVALTTNFDAMTTQATVDLFERAGFRVAVNNEGKHLCIDRVDGTLHLDHWPTVGKWMAWGKVWQGSTPDQVLEAIRAGRLRMPREIFNDGARDCRYCGATIYWTETDKGKRMPIEVDGRPHIANCERR